MAELLEYNSNAGNICFKNQVENIEFFEMIGNMDIYLCNNPKERDIKLHEIGINLFLDNPEYKKEKEWTPEHFFYNIEDAMHRFYSEIKNEYKLIEKYFEQKYAYKRETKEVLSQAEIDELLGAIN